MVWPPQNTGYFEVTGCLPCCIIDCCVGEYRASGETNVFTYLISGTELTTEHTTTVAEATLGLSALSIMTLKLSALSTLTVVIGSTGTGGDSFSTNVELKDEDGNLITPDSQSGGNPDTVVFSITSDGCYELTLEGGGTGFMTLISSLTVAATVTSDGAIFCNDLDMTEGAPL
jgi:hypothetical protein